MLSQKTNEQQNILLANQKQKQLLQQSSKSFKLPKIDRPISRSKVISRKQNKAPTYLPSINNFQQSDNVNFRNTDMIHINNHAKLSNQIIKDDFSLQVQSKLKNIIRQQSKKNQLIQSQSNTQTISDDDQDFQQKINQNKQIIKMHKQKNQRRTQKSQSVKLNQPTQKFVIKNKQKSTTTHNNKPLSNYQKKMKDYNNSLENKYLQRKKQSLGIISQKPVKPIEKTKSKKVLSMKQALDQAKASFGYRQFKSNGQIASNIQNNQNIQNSKPSIFGSNNNAIKISMDRMQKGQKLNSRKKTQQSISPRKGTLFDNIQSFLQNPTAVQKHQKFYKQIAKRLKNKDVNKLQQQIKQIADKIGIAQNNQTKSTITKQQNQKQPILITQNSLQRTVRDWKRVQIKDKNHINYHQSNFQKQLDYINYLQQKNSNSLSKFIDHQKIMVQLQLNHKFSKSIGKEQLYSLNRNQ